MWFRRLPRLFLAWPLFGVVLPAGLVVTTSSAADSAKPSRVQSLDGQWDIAFDPQDAGKSAGWFKPGGSPRGRTSGIRVRRHRCVAQTNSSKG